jgi:hypothetical protein
MQRRTLLTALGGLPFLAAAGAAVAEEGPLTRVYNEKDLTGWHVERGKITAWKANGELLSCTGQEGGYLCLDREYGDFELRLEYRIPPAGNTGVGIRFPRGGWPSTDGMEIQILDDAHPKYKDLGAEHKNGSVYSFAAPKASPGKPAGEWNRMTIRCKGPHLVVRINGVEVQNLNLDEQQQKGKGDLPLSQRPRKGLVGVQSHGDPVDFRRIEIREL